MGKQILKDYLIEREEFFSPRRKTNDELHAERMVPDEAYKLKVLKALSRAIRPAIIKAAREFKSKGHELKFESQITFQKPIAIVYTLVMDNKTPRYYIYFIGDKNDDSITFHFSTGLSTRKSHHHKYSLDEIAAESIEQDIATGLQLFENRIKHR